MSKVAVYLVLSLSLCIASNSLFADWASNENNLHELVLMGNLEQVKQTLSQHRSWANTFDAHGRTPLDCAESIFLAEDALLQVEMIRTIKEFGGKTSYQLQVTRN